VTPPYVNPLAARYPRDPDVDEGTVLVDRRISRGEDGDVLYKQRERRKA